MKKSIAAAALAFAVILTAVLFRTVTAQQPTPSDDDVNAIARELYCPVCENTPLDVCPTTACQQWRDLIRLKLSQGWEEAQIKDYFAEQYGDRVLAVPPRRGLNWLVYLLPPLSIIVGGVILYLALRRNRSSKAPAPVVTTEQDVLPPSPAEDDYLRRMEEELRRRQ